jgi:hypothetical protein
VLQITVPQGEYWDEAKEEFIYTKGGILKLEHSLISISNWESRWHVPFFDTRDKTEEQTLDYVRCMTVNASSVNPDLYNHLSMKNVNEINAYIEDPMTATIVRGSQFGKEKTTGEFITSELIYYWMIQYGIPVEFEKWHINRLIILIRVCSEKNKPNRKMNAREVAEFNKARNAARRAKYKTKG